MSGKKYYDEHGREVRSRPPKAFYNNWWFWLIVIIIILGSIYLHNNKKQIEVNSEKNEIIENENEKSEEDVIEENNDAGQSGEGDNEEEKYTYEDFKGTYVTFEGEPYNSPITSISENILVLDNDYYRSFNRWDFDMTSTIIDKKIDGNVLTIDVDSDESAQWGLHSESGTEKFKLSYDKGYKVLYSFEKDTNLFSMSDQDLQKHYNQSDIDYARIVMTLTGVPSLDMWKVFESKHDGEKPLIGVVHRKKGDIIPYTEGIDVSFPEDVIDVYLKNKTRQDEISYTFSYVKNGYIKVYPVPLNYGISTGEEVIEQAKVTYIEPFEPYIVADFIEHVEFDYE